MTENTDKKKIRPLRTAMIAAAAAAMMVVSVAAANPEGVQELWFTVRDAVRVDQYRMDLTTDSGERVSAITVPRAKLENRDGRAILVVDGRDVADITGALDRERHYVYEDATEGSKVSVTVDGTIDQWSIRVDVGKLEEDGAYDWFGGVTVTSEDADGGMGAQFFESGFFEEVHESAEAGGDAIAEGAVTYAVTEG